jgi:hypothetical protein
MTKKDIQAAISYYKKQKKAAEIRGGGTEVYMKMIQELARKLAQLD